MKREEIKKPDYTAGIRHTTVGSDRHDVRRENFRNKTVRTAKRRSGLIAVSYTHLTLPTNSRV